MVTRPLTIHELDILITLEHSLADSLAWAPATKEEQQPLVARGDVFGIFEGTALVGKVGFLETEHGDWQVDGLIIDPRHHGKGLGTILFRYALDSIIRKSHPTQLHLFVYPKNSAAIILYLRHGFVIQELIPDKYGPGKDRLKLIKIIS